MKFPFFVAQRYFRLNTSKKLTHRIGLISSVSIALSTMALLLVLSVFNGLEELVRSLLRSFDPDIKITLNRGKFFTLDPNISQKIATIAGVSEVTEILEDNALICHQDSQLIARVKGVSESFLHQSRLEPFIKQGSFKLKQQDKNWAIIGIGVQYALSISLDEPFNMLQVFYPKNLVSNTSLPTQMYNCKSIRPGAIFAIEKQLNENYVIVPIDFAAALMGMRGKRTALEIQVAEGFSVSQIQQKLQEYLPDSFQVLNSYEQQTMLMQVIRTERFFVFITLSFILLIASLNIFFVLSLLVLDKRKDIAVLYTLGATSKDIKLIFLVEGLLVALSGAAVGMVAAWGISWLQQTFELITVGSQTSLLDAYPIKKKVSDFVYTTISVGSISLIAAYHPAQLATKTRARIAF